MKQKKLGILYIMCAAFCFALMNLFVRLSGDLPVMQKSLFRNLVAAVIAFAAIVKEREKIQFRTEQASAAKNMAFLLIRAGAGTIGILCNFYAVGALNIADASMLNKLSPFFAIIFSIFVLNERPKRNEWLAVMVAFVGALFVMKPSFHMESIPALIGLCGGLFARKYLHRQGNRAIMIETPCHDRAENPSAGQAADGAQQGRADAGYR